MDCCSSRLLHIINNISVRDVQAFLQGAFDPYCLKGYESLDGPMQYASDGEEGSGGVYDQNIDDGHLDSAYLSKRDEGHEARKSILNCMKLIRAESGMICNKIISKPPSDCQYAMSLSYHVLLALPIGPYYW